jgi:hypothetical protein
MTTKTLSFKVEIPAGADKEVKESLERVLKLFELSFKISVAQKLVEKKGLKKRESKKIIEDLRKAVAERVLS